jgi:gliding motility-associated-like protein
VCADVAPFLVNAGAGGSPGVFSGNGITNAGIFSPATVTPGIHTIRFTATGANGCTDFREQPAQVFPVPAVSAGADKFVLQGGSTTLNGSGTGNAIRYSWTPATWLSNAAVAQPVATPQDDITYTLTATSAEGCIASDVVLVKVLKTPGVPNTFSPNGDGIHDRWEIQYLNTYPGVTVDIYNRYGQLVYQSVGYGTAWDGTYKGKPLPAGTYYYIINPKNGRKAMTGFVDIIR